VAALDSYFSMDAKPEHNVELTEDDLLSFVAGKADTALKKRIAAEMEKDGSFAQAWLRRLQAAAADPLNVDWAGLVDSERQRNRGKEPDGGSHGKG
jgi:hypothetical protein